MPLCFRSRNDLKRASRSMQHKEGRPTFSPFLLSGLPVHPYFAFELRAPLTCDKGQLYDFTTHDACSGSLGTR